MNGFYITISNGLLEGDHRKKMGSSVWEFMWLLDKVTSVDEGGIGKVLGGRPIKLSEFGTGIDTNTISRNLQKLRAKKYINITHAPYGLIVTINKTQKTFNQKRGYTKVENQQKRRTSKNVEPLDKNVEPLDKNVEPLLYDKTVDKTVDKTLRHKENNNILDAKRPLSVNGIKKEPSKKQLPYFNILDHLETTLNTKITMRGKQCSAIKSMLNAGYTELQIIKTIDYMANKDDFYSDKGFDMTTVAKQISLYKAQMRKAVTA